MNDGRREYGGERRRAGRHDRRWIGSDRAMVVAGIGERAAMIDVAVVRCVIDKLGVLGHLVRHVGLPQMEPAEQHGDREQEGQQPIHRRGL